MNPSAPEGLWDPPQPPFDHAPPSPLLPQPPTAPSSTSTPPGPPPRRARVTSAPPTKRITFFRSGDNQFGGFRMAIHRRRFKCFDALLDDLSQKVPLPFGVRTVTTPRGTRSIKHLEQLQDGGCYLCSDRRQAKPVDLELAGKRPVVWQYQGRRPRAPSAGQHPHPPPPPGGAQGAAAAAAAALLRQRRRILLVKNSEPGLRRSVVLGRRNGRSLRAFLDEVSHVMQFHVHRLYTVDGRKIDSVQSLVTCPGVLVCAGSREAFSAVLLDCNNRKNSEEKLPGLPCEVTRTARSPPATQTLSRSPPSRGAQCSPPRVARSRASDGSEGSKKSVNFGLETKKSVIHRRSDSSARSTRFSVSSDADKGCPLHPHHQARTVFGNDDIEKRVLVNKDGSLSVEMKVRFRLHNQETVQWSTHITKSPPASLLSSDCCPLKEDQPCYLRQGQSESCGSDPDSALSASCDHAVADYMAQSLPGRALAEENRCPCCCQRHHEQYDLWENPVHSHTHPACAPRLHASSRHSHCSTSSSSSCHSRRFVRRRATRRSDSGSERSRVVREEEVCVMEEVQRQVVQQSGDSCVEEVCRIQHCSSRSEVEVDRDGTSDGEERPPSAISNSSRVLQALQEDDDDREEDDPSAGASPCCPGREPSLFPATPRPPSHRSVGSACSAERGGTPRRGEGGCQENQMDRAASSRSEASRTTSRRSTAVRTPGGEDEGGAAAADGEAERRVQSGSSTRAGSARSRTSSACTHCGGCQRGSSTAASCNSRAGEESCSRASRRSHRSHGAATADPTSPNGEADCVVGAAGASDDSDASAASIRSNRSNLTHQECFSALSNVSRASDRSKHSPAPPSGGEPPAELAGPEEEEEERAPSTASAASCRSRTSHRSDCGEDAATPDAEASGRGTTEGEQEAENDVERAASTVSAKSNTSARSAESRKSNGDARASAQTPAANTADVEEADTNDTKEEGRASSVLSTKSAKSDKSSASKVSGVSRTSGCSHCGKAPSPCPNGADNATGEESRDEEQEREEEEEMDGRAASAMSAKSNLSGKSSKSSKPRSHSPTSEAADDAAARAASAMSAKSTKSNVSAGSAKSRMSDNNGSSNKKEEVGEEVDGASLTSETGGEKGEGEEMEVGDKTEGGDEHEERAASATSVKSARSNLSAKSSKSHKSICKHTDIPTIETNGAEGGTDEVHEMSDERAASAMSAKSKLSVMSSGSRKCDSNGGKREGGEEKLEARSVSAMSAKSTKSNASAAKSHRSGRGVIPAEVPVIETTDADEAKAVEERTPSSVSTKTPTGGDGGSARSKSALSAVSATARSPSPSKTPTPRSPSRRAPSTPKGAAPYAPSTPQTPRRRQLLPGSEAGARGSSALSVRSAASTRSNGSTCHCGKKEEEDEELEHGEEKATERAASVLSASLGVERPLSAASSGSVSLGLPEDREHESMTSDVSVYTRSNLSAVSSKVKPVDIPTIETTGGNEEANEGEMPTVERSASALSAKSNVSAKSSRSQKSSLNVASPRLLRGSKGQNVSAGPAKTGHGKSTIYLNTPDNRTPSAMSSSSSNKVRIKSPTRASPKPTTPVPAGDSATIKPSRPSEGKGEDTTDENAPPSSIPRSPNRLRPQSAASSSRSDNKKSPPKESSRPQSAVAADDSKSAVEDPNESTLSKSLSAADLLRETMAAGRPLSRGSKASQRSGGASRASERRTEALTPACLPNSSLNEVVSDWLKNIPTCMFAPGDELSDGGGHERGKEADDGGRGGEEVEKEVEDVEKVEEEEEEEEEAEGDAVEEEKSDAALMPTADKTPSNPAALFQGRNSSVAVMKVLLNPVTGRCRSLPEVSPVYGRRLSTSAQGLLSCLAQLQLMEPGSVSDSLSHAEPRDRNQRYVEIITLLQSLWLSKPKDKEAGQQGQVSPPRSSSGVGMSSGSGGSGNNGIDGGDGKAADNDAAASTPVADTPGQGETEAGEDKPALDDGTQGGEEEPTHGAPELPAEPDGKEPSVPAEETTKLGGRRAGRSPSPACGDEITDNLKREEGPSVDSPSVPAAPPPPPPPHQDPDPVWVLRLLKKLETQFMNHYTDAMAEFKVRWDLDDSLMLDAMIKELREEVSQRIQGSIGRELKKIQGRAGRAPRPPAGAQLSRESTMTERRRRMLKVMKNQSVSPDSLSDDDTAGEYSDQRSDDDYCPCDACVAKKMAARPPKMHPAANAAPVLMAFDLRKILQQKKAPETTPPPPAANAAPVMAAFDLRKILQVQKPPEAPPPSPPASPDHADGSDILEVVQEEEEEEEEGETQRQEEEEEEGKETGEEMEEEEGGERAEEECECRHPHETEGEGGEEEGEADEESSGGEKTEGETETDEGKAAGEGTETDGEEEDSNKVTEATRDGGETSENDDGEQEEEEEEEEEEEGEEATGEEKSEDAVENEEGSTPVEESTEGNAGASAEDDDEREDGEKGMTEEDESGAETASNQRKGGVPLVCVTEGEDSDVGSTRPSEAGDGTAEDEGEKEEDEGEKEEDEGEKEEDVVEEKQVNGLSHQYTRTSVESQPGSMEAIDPEPGRMASPLRPVKSQETGPQMVAAVSRGEGVAGKGQRRSRSPARVRRRKPNGSDIELDDMDI